MSSIFAIRGWKACLTNRSWRCVSSSHWNLILCWKSLQCQRATLGCPASEALIQVNDMTNIKVIVEKHPDGYVAYPLGLKGVVVGEGDTYKDALADVRSAIRFHIETFGDEILQTGIGARSAVP